ncbi:MAG: hypothetical protein FWE57_10030 [Chitinispirillia bacterium]|nr:hypothetical protein [Chitinispirillia bacterium]
MKKLTKAAVLATTIAAMKLAGCADMNIVGAEANNNSNQTQYEIPTTEPTVSEPSKFTQQQPARQSDTPVVHPDGWLPLVETEAWFGKSVDTPNEEWIDMGWATIYSPHGRWSSPRTNVSIQLPDGRWFGGEVTQDLFCSSGMQGGSGLAGDMVATLGTCREIGQVSILPQNRTIPGQPKAQDQTGLSF